MADTKLSALTADTDPSTDDLIYTVNDPGGTPASRKVTIANFKASTGMTASATEKGCVELATDAETETGTDTVRATTPANVTAVFVKKSLIDAKGDLVVGTATDTPARLAVGSDYYPLVADSSTSEGLAWLLPILAATGFGALAMASGRYYVTQSPGSTLALTAGTAYYLPVWFGRSCTLDRVAVSQTATGGASSTMRLGLYAPHATTGLPDAVVADFGTVTGTGTGLREITISQAVKAGMYWGCIAAQGTGSPTIRASAVLQHGAVTGDSTSTNFNNGDAVYSPSQTGVTGAFATAAPNGVVVTVYPTFAFRAT